MKNDNFIIIFEAAWRWIYKHPRILIISLFTYTIPQHLRSLRKFKNVHQIFCLARKRCEFHSTSVIITFLSPIRIWNLVFAWLGECLGEQKCPDFIPASRISGETMWPINLKGSLFQNKMKKLRDLRLFFKKQEESVKQACKIRAI